jgi:hypothetical protein
VFRHMSWKGSLGNRGRVRSFHDFDETEGFGNESRWYH